VHTDFVDTGAVRISNGANGSGWRRTPARQAPAAGGHFSSVRKSGCQGGVREPARGRTRSAGAAPHVGRLAWRCGGLAARRWAELVPASACHPGPMADDELETLLAEQIAYYRTRAVEYDSTYPLDVHADAVARAELLTTLEGLAPFGRTLELACGTGQWTVELARRATAVTAVDAAPEALAICRQRVGADVRLVEADLFTWRPRERYEFVFFSAWLSHVPPQRFDAFWALVADCLKPDGRVFVIDELPAVAAVERPAAEQPAPAVYREVAGVHSFRAVKVLYAPDDLRVRLDALGWQTDIRTVGWRFYSASLHRG
jgi:SAM-dependent methyltransferase